MGREKMNKDELMEKEKEFLSFVYINGWGVMMVTQLVSIVKLCSPENLPETTIRDRIDRLVEAGIFRKHRLNGKYYVFIRQSGIDYFNRVRTNSTKYFWNHPASTPCKQRAILKSVLVNGYLIKEIQKKQKDEMLLGTRKLLTTYRNASTIWFRAGYNAFALYSYMEKRKDPLVIELMGREAPDRTIEKFKKEIRIAKDNIEFQKKILETKTCPASQWDEGVRMGKEIDLAALAKNHIYIWLVQHKEIPVIKMIILDMTSGEGVRGRLYKNLLRCRDVANYYWGNQYILSVDFVVGTDDRAEILRKLISKEHKKRVRNGLENIELDRRVSWSVVSCGENGLQRRIV